MSETTTSRAADTAAARVHVEWSEDRARAVERSMFARKRRRTQMKGAMAVAFTVIAILSFGVAWKRLHGDKPAPQALGPTTAPALEGQSITFADGSVAAPLDPQSLVQSKEVTASKIDVELVKGSAHFEVSKHPERVFRVEAGNVTVEVLGTGFVVERLGDGARVSVEHGRVKVQWGAGSTILGDGQGSTFPPAAEATSTTATSVDTAPPPSTSTSATIAPKATWKVLAHDGEFDKAYAALKVEGGPTAVHDDAGELLLAADVARLSHHPADAVVHLRRVVTAHAGDPRAPLAAFTLGRVLLEELGQPGQAAEAFAKARALGGAGPLAEDALAREVEAWWRAGATDKAHERAEEYVKLYPKGLRVRSVKKYGGLEE